MISGYSNMFEQHANATNEWMITELLKMNALFHNCLKICSKAWEMEWLCNDRRFCLKWKNTCKMAEKKKWEK